MNINTNRWNKIRYSIHSIYYDLILHFLKKEREKALRILAPTAGDSILIVGAGTGGDLPYLNSDYKITATDLTPAMLRKLTKRAEKLEMDVRSMEMDGQALKFDDNTFDCVILTLILAVIPNPYQCIKEAERVLKPGGKVLVFDKFLNDKQSPSLLRKFLNVFASVLFTDVNRKTADIFSVTNLKVETEQPSIFDGFFKIYVLRK